MLSSQMQSDVCLSNEKDSRRISPGFNARGDTQMGMSVPLPHSSEPVITAIQFRKMQIHFNYSYLFSGISALMVEYYEAASSVNHFFKKIERKYYLLPKVF